MTMSILSHLNLDPSSLDDGSVTSDCFHAQLSSSWRHCWMLWTSMCRASNSRSPITMARMMLAECCWMQLLIMKSGSGGDFHRQRTT
jgi:hypothetical protein